MKIINVNTVLSTLFALIILISCLEAVIVLHFNTRVLIDVE